MTFTPTTKKNEREENTMVTTKQNRLNNSFEQQFEKSQKS